jgi:hypothetical protein
MFRNLVQFNNRASYIRNPGFIGNFHFVFRKIFQKYLTFCVLNRFLARLRTNRRVLRANRRVLRTNRRVLRTNRRVLRTNRRGLRTNRQIFLQTFNYEKSLNF